MTSAYVLGQALGIRRGHLLLSADSRAFPGLSIAALGWLGLELATAADRR